MGVLLGDVNGDGTVNTGDTMITRNLSGATATQQNAPADVNTDGVINSGDTIIVRNAAGTSLP